jgi:UDP-N-acetylmuramate-alanine ligase
MEDRIRAIAAPGDIILTVGAGDIYQIGENLVKSSDVRSRP